MSRGPGGGINTQEADYMQNVVFKSLLVKNSRSQLFVFTGSAMALTWQALANMPKYGRSSLTAIRTLQLPSTFPPSHMQVSLV